MIAEDYVSFETAKLLKEKGYWNIATMLYKENGDIVNYNVPLNNKGFSSTLGVFYEAPTLQMAMKWLREKHILVLPEPKSFTLDGEVATWVYNIWCDDNREVNADFFDGEPFEKYEDACEAAIKYCLENLI